MRYLPGVTTLELDRDKCVGCGVCLQVCPHEVFRMDGRTVLIHDRDACMECGACAINCATGALRVQAGVGCASAVINSALGRKSSGCCNLENTAPKIGAAPADDRPAAGIRCC